jgi:hypothetical protein
VEVAVMVGGFPRKAGMERKDVMAKNVSIYATQARALEQYASRDVKVRLGCCWLWWCACQHTSVYVCWSCEGWGWSRDVQVRRMLLLLVVVVVVVYGVWEG